MNNMQHMLAADWPAPDNILAFTTLRTGGVSSGIYKSWNLADHVADDKEKVSRNRIILENRLNLSAPPVWLQQIHGSDIFCHDSDHAHKNLKADGSYTEQQNVVCCVLTADCLPVLICNKQGTEVAAVHAGWRGFAAGVVEAALKKFTSKREDLLVWLGPAIGPEAFEVGEEVRDAFLTHDPHASMAFKLSRENTLLANIYQLARQRLLIAGVTAVFGGHHCTYNDEEQFFSYRRDPVTGRMASLIWVQS